MRVGRIPGLRQIPPSLRRVDQHAALFDSWHGSYSDNPRAISEALRGRDPAFEHLWATEEAGFAPNSRRYLEALGRARYVVTNVNMPGYFRKKRGTKYVQTWHGTPLKRIGFDILHLNFPRKRRYLTNLTQDVAKWDVLVSPNRFSTEVFRAAFRFEGPIIETGYPRNDVLSSPEADGIGAAVRASLSIPADSRVVLYAPTWRDKSSFSLELDLPRLTESLGDDCRVLLRAHRVVADETSQETNPRVVNVSHYPDIRDLYLASDVLVTDYSSAMFDFAVTGKPMLLYTYDLAQYRDEAQGFYFEFEREAPGPLLSTTADVCEALQELDDVRRQYAGAYTRFARRFCYLEDGQAAERVIDAAFTD